MITRAISMLAGVAGAVAVSQAPGYTLQYMQNLEGRVDELRTIVERFEANIAEIGYDRERALAECSVAEQLLGALCDGITEDIARYEALRAHQAELLAAEGWARPVVLARNVQADIAESAYDRFEPAVPATATGAGYAAAGFAGAWGLLTMVLGLATAPFRRREAY